MRTNFKTPVLSAVTFFGTLGILSVGYSAYVSSYPAAATPSAQVSSTEWNKMVTALQTLDGKLSAFTITAGGNVGIGPASPTTPLEVGNGTTVRGYVKLNNDSTNSPVLQLANAMAGGRTYNVYSGFYANTGSLVFADLTAGNVARMTLDGNGNVGIGTSAPTEKLEVNGNLKFTSNGSTISKAPRAVHSVDPVTGCPPSRAANTDLWTMPITLDRASTVWLSGDVIKNSTLRADLQLFMDGSQLMQTIAPAVASDWAGAHVQWSGTVAAGSHTVSLRSPQASVWGCGTGWGTMDALIFEN